MNNSNAKILSLEDIVIAFAHSFIHLSIMLSPPKPLDPIQPSKQDFGTYGICEKVSLNP